MPIIKAKKLDNRAKLPSSAHDGDLGCDLYALDTGNIQPGTQIRLHTGIALEFPPGWGGIIKDRSSLASLRIYTAAGVIDGGYRGEIVVLMRNDGDEPYRYHAGDKMAQIVPVQVGDWTVEECNNLSGTSRADGGFGSTGKK